MKISHERFARLMATGAYTVPGAYREIFGQKKKVGGKAQRIFKMPEVKKLIADLQDQEALRLGLTSDYVKSKLMSKIEADDEALKAIDILNRMNGYYEKDNKQTQQQVVINTNF